MDKSFFQNAIMLDNITLSENFFIIYVRYKNQSF